MKILYLMSDFPYPPRGGGALRIMGLVNGAVEAGHAVHILSFGENIAPDTPLHSLCKHIQLVPPPQRTKIDRLKTLLLTHQADMERRSWSDAFVKILAETLQRTHFDIVQFQSLEMGIYLETVRRLQPSAALIYDAYNAEAELQRMVYATDRQHLKMLPMAVYSWIQWRRLTTFERRLCQSADGVIAVSDADKAILSAVTDSVWLVNNGIQVSDYEHAPQDDLGLKQPALIFTGIMDYRPNVDAVVWFAEKILPHIRQAHLYIVGNRPNGRVMTLAEHPNITVTGYVEDVLPYLHQGMVFVVPLRVGSGTRFKLLQAMSAGCAIVSTSVGAMGLDVQHESEVLLADDAHAFADSVNILLRDASQRQALARAGHDFVKTRFDWSVIVPHLLTAYEEITRIKKPASK